MSTIKYHKVVSALPTTLDANSVYYVRVGTGFDMYVTNDMGIVTAYGLNTGTTDVLGTEIAGLSASTSSPVVDGDTILTAVGKLQAQVNGASSRILDITSTATVAPTTFADVKVGRVMEFDWAPVGNSNAVVAADFIQQTIDTSNGNTIGSSHSVGLFVYQLVKGGGSTITNFSHEMRFGVIDGTSVNQMVGIKYVLDEDTAANGTVDSVVLEEITHQTNSNWFGKLERRFLDPRLVTQHAGGTIFSPTVISGNYTFTDADSGKHFLYYASGTGTLTIPDTLTPGFTVRITQGSAGAASLATTGGIAMYNVGGRYVTSYIGDVAVVTLHPFGYVGVDFLGQSTHLAIPRTINGVSFDGTSDITIVDSTKEPAIASGTTVQYFRGDKTWADLETAVRSTSLTGLTTGSASAVTASDTVLTAIQKLQAQVSSSSGPGDTVASVAITSGSLDLRNVEAETVQVTLNQNITGILLPSVGSGQRRDLVIMFTQDGTGGRTVAGWPSGTTYENGMIPNVASTALASTRVSMSNISGTGWFVYSGTVNGGNPVLKIPTTARIVLNAAAGTALTTIAAVAARLYYIPFTVARRVVVSALGFSVSTLTAGTATVGIYASNGSATFTYPGTIIAKSANGAINTGTTGTKTATVSCVLEPGVVYFASIICSAACTLRGVAVAGQPTLLGFTDNSTTVISYYYSAGSTNVMPTTADTPIAAPGVVTPAVYLVEAL